MLPSMIVKIELRKNHISICGTPLKYLWSDDLEFIRSEKSIKLPAVIDAKDLSNIYVLVGSRRFLVEAMTKPDAKMYEFTVQENLWGEISLQLLRKTKGSKKYNEEQSWIDAEIAPPPRVCLLKKDQIKSYLAKEIIFTSRISISRAAINDGRCA